ncbi:MAG: hypothetical protein OXG46_10695 [Chloroflexi bacterium]|nr:hypothetical protein [Chloroflexota bacterium]
MEITNRRILRIVIVATGLAVLLMMLPKAATADHLGPNTRSSYEEFRRDCTRFFNGEIPPDGSYGPPSEPPPSSNIYIRYYDPVKKWHYECQMYHPDWEGWGPPNTFHSNSAPDAPPDDGGGGGGGGGDGASGSGGGGGGGDVGLRQVKPPDLQVDLTVEAEPVAVGGTVTYNVKITNNTDGTMTGLRWRDKTSGGGWTNLDDLEASKSVTVSGSFGPVQTMHLPGIILTVAADSDQTEERPASRYVQLVPAAVQGTQGTRSTRAAAPQRTPVVTTAEPSGPFATPSVLSLRVERVTYTAPDIHLGHNIADYMVTLPDGEEVACNFLGHYDATGGLTRWGHAISDVIEEMPGTLTQYYQKGAADCHPVYAKTWVTEPRLVWDYIGGGKGGAPDLGTEPGLVSEQPGVLLWWGHRISDYAIDGTEVGFRGYFDALGGTQSFGYPKTDARIDNHPQAVLRLPNTDTAVIRQYFQAAVLEYHPADELQPVKTALLGDLVRNMRYPRESYLAFGAFETAPKRSVGETYTPERAVFPP